MLWWGTNSEHYLFLLYLSFNDLDSFTTIPTNPGPPLSTLNYIIVIRLGMPEKTLQMVFDTGSHLTWTQCYQCKSCYEQANARFNPLNSSTYEASDCLDDTCKNLISSGQGLLQMSRHWHWRVVQCLAGASGGTVVPQLVLTASSHVNLILATTSGGTT
ncbi:Aspartyl protease AED1 [Glycine soja]